MAAKHLTVYTTLLGEKRFTENYAETMTSSVFVLTLTSTNTAILKRDM